MMKVLIVASNNKGRFAPFVVEQAEALRHCGCEVDFYGIAGKGVSGYLKNLTALKKKIREFQPAVIHAHYGLSGLLATLQRKVPVVTTYHGSDINDPRAFRFSKLAVRWSAWNVFVSREILDKARPFERYSLIPCGVDMDAFQSFDKHSAREMMHLSQDKKYVLFAGSFDNAVKNAPLAQETVALLRDDNVELLELKGYARHEVNLLLCAVDVLLMTSLNEGSPQVIKEAMACGCPIVSVEVGDVLDRLRWLDGCYMAQTRDADELTSLLIKAFAFEGRTEGRARIIDDELDNRQIAKRLVEIYERVRHD